MLLDVFKGAELIETIELSASKRVYKVGRQAGAADIVLAHGSISREQATLTVSASGTVVVHDLGSAHGTLLSGKRIPPKKPHLLPPGRSLMFGQSTRVFKLREGGGGFVTAAGAGAASAASTQAAAAAALALDDPRVQAALKVLQHGDATCGERLRPDGYLRLRAVLDSAAVQRTGCTEADLANLAARLSELFQATTDDEASGGTGEILLRALEGCAPQAPRSFVTLLLACCLPQRLHDVAAACVLAACLLACLPACLLACPLVACSQAPRGRFAPLSLALPQARS